MAILDRFRSSPAHKHPDPEVRLAYVETLTIDDREPLAAAAREDESARVRRAAVGKLMDPSTLALVVRDDPDAGVRTQAMSMLRDIALEAFEETGEPESLAAIDAITDVKILSQVVKTVTRESSARHALARVTEPRALGSIARHAGLEPIRRAALDAIQDHEELVAVAMNGEFKDAAVAAVERLTDRADLELIASRANNKNAMKRARTILRELDERIAVEAAPAAPAAPPSAGPRTEIEPEAIVQRLAALSSVDDPQTLEAALQDLDARWTALDAAADAGIETRYAAAAENVRARIAGLRALEAERAAVEAESARQRDEQLAAGRAAAEAAAAELARKEAERRSIRLLELVAEVEAAAADEDLRSAKRRIGLAQREWKDMTVDAAADAELAARFTSAETRLIVRDIESKESDRRARRDALNRLHQLLARVEPLASRDDLVVKAVERALSDVRAALAAMPPLPSKQDYDDGVRRLKAVQAALTPKLQELREIEGWQRWANVGIQEQLCEKMEALKAAEDPEEIARRIRELQQQWRQAADVPRAQGEELWRRFKAAHDEVWTRCEAHFAAEAGRRQDNLAKKIALCERAEALTGSTNWMQTAEEIKRLQADWKTIGPVSRGQEKPVWERFRGACDRFFTRRHEDLAQRKSMWAENLAKKDALCARAEALAASTEWDAAAAELRRLQGEWKAIGPVKKSRSEAIWQRFRGACDRFFVRFAQRHEIAREERVAAREAICAELAAFAAPEHDAASAGQGPVAPEHDAASAGQGPVAPEHDAASAGQGPVAPEHDAASARQDPAAPEDAAAATPAPPDAGRDDAGASQDPPPDLLATVRSLRTRWQQELALRGVDPDRAADLERRFAAAFERVIARWPQIFAGTDLDPDANRRRMEALVLRVEAVARSLVGPAAADADNALTPATRLAAMLKEALASNTIGGKVDDESRWRAAQEDVRQAQTSWSHIGTVPEPARRALADRFQRACRLVLDRPGGSPGSGASGRPAAPGAPNKPGSRPLPGRPGGISGAGGPGRPGGAGR